MKKIGNLNYPHHPLNPKIWKIKIKIKIGEEKSKPKGHWTFKTNLTREQKIKYNNIKPPLGYLVSLKDRLAYWCVSRAFNHVPGTAKRCPYFLLNHVGSSDARTLWNGRSTDVGSDTTWIWDMCWILQISTEHFALFASSSSLFISLFLFFPISTLYTPSAAYKRLEKGNGAKFSLLSFFFPFLHFFPSFPFCVRDLGFCLSKMKMGFI